MTSATLNGVFADAEARRSAVIEARDNLADALGEDRARIRIVQSDWVDQLRFGAFIIIHIGRRRFRVALTWEDMGIRPTNPEEEAALGRVATPGDRYLLPKNLLADLEALEHKARRLLSDTAARTHRGYFLYAGEDGARYAAWKTEELKVYRAYMAARDDICGRYPELIASMRDDYRTLATKAYGQLVNAGMIPAEDPTIWVEQRVDTMLRNVPNVEDVRASFLFDWDIEMATTALDAAKDQAEASRVIADRESLNAFQRDIYKARMDEALSFQRELYADLKANCYATVIEIAEGAVEALTGEAEMTPGAIRRLRTLVETVEGLNPGGWLDDIQLQGQMGVVRDLIRSYGSVSAADVRTELSRLRLEAQATLKEIGRDGFRRQRDIPLGNVSREGVLAREARELAEQVAVAAETPDDLMRAAREIDL